jgi:arylsulfatase A-like enzyme
MKILIKKASGILLILTALMVIVACGRRAGVNQNLPASIVWEKDQSLIHPKTGSMNIWEGWTVKGNYFEASKGRSRFVFWRTKSGSLRFHITYSLKSNNGILACNREKVALPPAEGFSKISFDFDVKRGFNFLETSKKSGDTLRIRQIQVGNSAPDDRLLREGERWVEYFSPGMGSLLFRGKGTVVIEKAEVQDGKIKNESRMLEAARSRKDLLYDFSFVKIGYLKVSVQKGAFDILRHEFRPKTETPLPAVVMTEKRPDIFIFLIDACQAKHLSTYGYERKTSPSIDELAKDSVVFENAYANATFTPASVATILTGLYPERHNLRIQINRLPDGVYALPEFMKSLEYRTAIFSSSVLVIPKVGFHQGVDDFIVHSMRARPNDPRRPDSGSAPPLTEDFYRWLSNPGPRFAYLHFMEPHWPLLPPPPFLNMFKESRSVPAGLYDRMRDLGNSGHQFSSEEIEEARADYDSDIAYIDFQLGEMWNWLRKHDLYEESVIILVADHGEALFEHGQVWSHGVNVFDETTHVPLIIKLPKSLNMKGRISNLVQLVDIFPTIAGLFGKTVECDGRDALRLFGQKEMDDTFAVSRTGWYSTGEDPATYSMRWKNWYYILDTKTREAQLYQLDGDPQRDVLRLNPTIATLFAARFISWYKNFEKLDVPLGRLRLPKLSPEEVEALKSLGYI